MPPPTDRPDYALRIRDRLSEQRERVIHDITGGEALCHALSDVMDHAIEKMFEAVCAELGVRADDEGPGNPALVILATGGYGRRELSPGSDIDIAFVPSGEGHPQFDEVARRMYHLLMDLFTVGARLTVGYSYRRIDDCDGLEHPTQTALLDARPVAGSATLAHRFDDALMETLRPAAFTYSKDEERRAGWRRHGDLFSLEPNVKDGAGGLRDIQAAGWIARARYGIRHGALWSELRGLGVISDRDRTAVMEARELLLDVRHRLHRLTGRANDVLTADRQEALSRQFATTLSDPVDGDVISTVAFMRRIYQAMETLHRNYRRIAETCLEGPLTLDRRLVVVRGRIRATDPDLLDDDPSLLARIFRHFHEFGFRPDQDLERIFTVESRRGHPALQAKKMVPLLLDLLSYDRVAPAIRLMADLGLLERALPEFDGARTLIPLTLVHHHTVGEHSLRALSMLETLPVNDDPGTDELRRIAADRDLRLDILRLALLLHDVGKANPNGDHCRAGAEIADGVAERLGMSAGDRDLLQFLILRHQSMAETAQMRDLTDDRTIRVFVEDVANVDRLRLLYLFTYADMKATGPGIWTAVSARFIEDLFCRAESALLHGLPDVEHDPGFARYRKRMRRELAGHNLPDEVVEAHCALMPAAYLLNTALDEIAAHVRSIDRLTSANPAVDFLPGPGSATVMTLCAYDDPQPGLLSKVAAVLHANDVVVHAAQVYTRDGSPRIAIDTLWTEYQGRELPPGKRRDIEGDLIAIISGGESAVDLLRRKGKRIPPIPAPRIEIRSDLSERHSVVEIDSADAKGLLYRVTRAMSEIGWNIHVAKVSTLIGEARDAFYVTDPEGRKVSEDPAPLLERIVREM